MREPSHNPALLFAMAAALAGFGVAAFAPQILNDADTWWHLAAGNWMLANHAVPVRDIFSFTRAGAPWNAQEWLAEVVMAAAFRLGGWSGLHVLFGFAAAATAGVTAYGVRQRMDTIPALLTTILGLACASGSLLARPHLLALPLLAIWTWGLVTAREEKRAPSLWLAGVMLVWSNLHGSFAFGLALAAALGIEAVMADRRPQTVKGWSIFFAASLAAAAITPQGLNGLLFPVLLLAKPGLAGVGEWAPSDFSHLSPFLLALLALFFAFASGRVALKPLRALIVTGLIYLACTHARHQMILGVAGPLLLATALGLAWPVRFQAIARWQGFAVAGLFVLALIIRLVLHALRGEDRVTPIAALEEVPQHLRGQPVLNAYDYGGYLIYNGVKVFIDGRTDLYDDAFLKNYDAIAAGDAKALATMLVHDHIAWTIFPVGSPTVATLDHLPGWHRLVTTPNAVVHVKE
jgi:hypothetical protein